MKIVTRYLAALSLVFVANQPPSRESQTNQFTLAPIPASAVHHPHQGAPHLRNANGTSQNWSGYAAETSLSSPQDGAVTDVKGSWIVPAVTASSSSKTYSSAWLGIDGYSDGTVEQIGTEQDWSNGQAVYYAWFEMYPKFGYLINNFPVNPRDSIACEVHYNGNGTYTLTIRNVTRNATFSITQRLKRARNQSAEWVMEAPYSGGILPLADFGTINFSNCGATLNGVTGSISTWPHDAITMSTASGTVKAQPSGLSASGSSFSVTWHHE